VISGMSTGKVQRVLINDGKYELNIRNLENSYLTSASLFVICKKPSAN